MTKITIRRFDRNVVQALTNRGFPEPLARALAARHVTSPSDLDYEFKEMLSPWDLKNCREAGEVSFSSSGRRAGIRISTSVPSPGVLEYLSTAVFPPLAF